MSYSLIAHVTAAAGASSAINTTGADFLVCVVAAFNADFAAPSDSKSNIWTPGTTAQDGGGSGEIGVFFSQTGNFGSGHTFTPQGSFAAGCFAAFSGSVATPHDQFAQALGQQAGSVTPSVDDEMLIAGYGDLFTPSSVAINGGFTAIDCVAFASGTNYAVTMAYLVQTAKAAANPTWSDATAGAGSCIATFKGTAGGGGGGSNWGPSLFSQTWNRIVQ